jgi:hypothetical protein
VLLHPALVESSQIGWFDDPERPQLPDVADLVLQLRGDIVPLPYTETPAAERYLAPITRDRLADLDPFLIVTNHREVPFPIWLAGRLGDEGWTSRSSEPSAPSR